MFPRSKKKIFLSIVFSSPSDFIILDEPTNHLDASSVEYLKHLIESYDKAMIITTHDKNLNIAWDKIYTMDEGKLKLEEAEK